MQSCIHEYELTKSDGRYNSYLSAGVGKFRNLLFSFMRCKYCKTEIMQCILCRKLLGATSIFASINHIYRKHRPAQSLIRSFSGSTMFIIIEDKYISLNLFSHHALHFPLLIANDVKERSIENDILDIVYEMGGNNSELQPGVQITPDATANEKIFKILSQMNYSCGLCDGEFESLPNFKMFKHHFRQCSAITNSI